MPNRPTPDPVEATFRDVRGAVYSGDGRARQWLAESGLRPTVPGEPAPFGRSDLHGHP